MEEISHRQLQNDSDEIVRRAEAGETLVVTNHGRPAAVIGPPPSDVLSVLIASGQVRRATAPPSSLKLIKRSRSDLPTSEIHGDLRCDW